MFPPANAPAPAQQWVRDVTNRASAIQTASTTTERNAYALAGNAKIAYELIDDRIANIDSFTNGLLEQAFYDNSLAGYTDLSALPVLYEYASGSYQVKTGIVQRLSFASYNDLTVTTDGFIQAFTTDVTASTIANDHNLLPMIQATVPPLSIMYDDGRYVENGTSYASRWTVENLEQFVGFNTPGNSVPSTASSTYSQSPPGYHPDNGNVQIRHSRDGYTGYSMRYTREWLMAYMDAVVEYTNGVSPPPAGARYLPPDVNQVEIIMGYYYDIYTSGVATNILYLNDNRLTFSAGATFVLEGIKNLGY
jgi:hypothetical protein